MNAQDIRTIRPAEGRRVRTEQGELLEQEWKVPWSPWWQRRLEDGDIEIVASAKNKEA